MNITDRFDCRAVYWILQFSKSNLLMFQLLVICLWLSVCVLRDFSMQIHFARITLCTTHIPGAHYSYFISDAILSHMVLNHFGCGETCSNKRIPSGNLWYRIFLRPISQPLLSFRYLKSHSLRLNFCRYIWKNQSYLFCSLNTRLESINCITPNGFDFWTNPKMDLFITACNKRFESH